MATQSVERIHSAFTWASVARLAAIDFIIALSASSAGFFLFFFFRVCLRALVFELGLRLVKHRAHLNALHMLWQLRWHCAISVIVRVQQPGQQPDSSHAARCRTQWAARALLGPSVGSLVVASSVWAEVVSEPVLLSLVPSSMAPSGTLSLSSDAPSSLPGWASGSSEVFGFPESKKCICCY